MKAIITTFNMTESLKENYAKIQCPECNTEYAIPKEAVKKPIKVKCTNCGYTWRHKNNINEPLDEEKISSLVNGKNLIDQSQYADDDRGDFDYDEDDLLKVIVPEAEDKIEDTKVTRDDSVGEENDVQENAIEQAHDVKNDHIKQENLEEAEDDDEIIKLDNQNEETEDDKELDDLFAGLKDIDDEVEERSIRKEEKIEDEEHTEPYLTEDKEDEVQ